MLSAFPRAGSFLSDRTRLHMVYCGMNVNRKELLAALTTAARVAPKRSPRPTLQNVVLESVAPSEGGPALIIRATDLEMHFQTRIDTPGSGHKFRVSVNAKDARDVVKAHPGETIDVTDIPDSYDARIGSGMLRGEDPELFPEMPAQDKVPSDPVKYFSMVGEDFRRMVTEVAFAAAREGSRYAINGIMIEQKNNEVRFVATDGRRLSLSKLDGMGSAEFQVVVPEKALSVVRMAARKEELVKVDIETNNVRFMFGNTVMVLRQLETNFPEYSAVIPTKFSVMVHVDRKDLEAALKMLKPYTSGDVAVVRFDVSHDKLALSAKNSAGEGTQILRVNSQGAGFMGLNPDYLLQALKASTAGDVRLDFSAEHAPVMWNLGFTYVQMPISAV